MQITEVRFAFIEVETLADPLAALNPPAIPFNFLLNQAAYEAALADALALGGGRHTPWHDDFGKLFWYYYLERKSEFQVTFTEAWRGLVPLQEPSVGTASAAWLNGSMEVRPYVYPWGVAAIIDVHATGNWSLEEAVALGLKLRTDGEFEWAADGKVAALPMNKLMRSVLGAIRERAYGAKTPAGQAGQMFTVATVLDAQDAVIDAPVEDQSDLHRALYGFTTWSPFWKDEKKKLDTIDAGTFRIKQALAPAGHMLYGSKRGRAVWFPAGFPGSNPEPKGSPHCYHQNLTSAALQTEGLCALAAAVAKRIGAGQQPGAQSITYANCAKLAAGIIGRMHGGSDATYKSRSVRGHIQDNYLVDVNEVRKVFPNLKNSLLEFKPINT